MRINQKAETGFELHGGRQDCCAKVPSLLRKLTIILPTYNRQAYALRAMNFWSGSGVTLHVLDGSSKAIKDRHLAKIGKNVNYHHMPVSIIERLKKIVECLNTEYTMLSGDDDTFLISSIEKCIYEIEVSKELISCIGRSLGFLSDQVSVKGFPVYTEMRGYSLLQDDPIERMISHMNPYTCSIIYSVVQTDAWKKAMTALVEKDFQVPGLEELQFELVVSYLGKSKVIEELMWLRSFENAPIRDYPPTAVLSHIWWGGGGGKKKEHDEFLRIMSGTLVNDELNNAGKINDGLRCAMDAYTSQYHHKGPPMSSLQTLRPLNRPEKKEEKISLLEAAKNLEHTGVKVNFEELKQIINIINNFHANDKFVFEDKGM